MSGADDPALTSRDATLAMRQVYAEARSIARSVLLRAGPQTWETTLLVNEAFMRLLASHWADSVHSQPNAVIPLLRRVMENALRDHRRQRSSRKRPSGENRAQVYYDDGMAAYDDDPGAFLEILALMERLRAGQLGAVKIADPAKFAEVLECGFVLGCSAHEISRQMCIPQTTVSRWLRCGKALINHALHSGSDPTTP